MPSYRAPVEDTLFFLEDVLAIHRHDNLPGFSDASSDVLQAILHGELLLLHEGDYTLQVLFLLT